MQTYGVSFEIDGEVIKAGYEKEAEKSMMAEAMYNLAQEFFPKNVTTEKTYWYLPHQFAPRDSAFPSNTELSSAYLSRVECRLIIKGK